jgi:D-arabinose 1-dehydrogenase-like Zn-dependent alcohol dehydrogenase
MNFRCAHRWAFPAWGQDLEARDDDLAPPTGREVTVRVTHSGMCHSDLHIQAGGFDMGGGVLSSLERAGVKLPVTMGHEIGGQVVEVGPDVTDVKVGDRVVVYPWIGCGQCPTCERGDDHLCVKGARNLGLQLPGGYSDTVRVPHEPLLRGHRHAGPGACRHLRLRRHHRLRRGAQARRADGRRLGGHRRLRRRGHDGAGAVLHHQQGAHRRHRPRPRQARGRSEPTAPRWPSTRVRPTRCAIGKACGGNIAGAVDFVGSEKSSSLAVNLVRRTGQVVIVGLFGGEFKLPLPMFALKSLRIEGSYVGSLPDLRELVALGQRVTLPATPLDLRPLAASTSRCTTWPRAAWWAAWCCSPDRPRRPAHRRRQRHRRGCRAPAGGRRLVGRDPVTVGPRRGAGHRTGRPGRHRFRTGAG